jgi:CheY-like chemotaxis protein
MPLILAIEPDRRQASQLTAVVRGRLHAELVLADSAAKALSALGDRVPDLVLTPAFLSTKDEAMLAERLRELDAAAAHVQTLTIPVLATQEPRSSSGRGLFGLLGERDSSNAAPDGCDPAVFAEQCAAYLEHAATQREHQTVADSDSAPAPAELEQTEPEEIVEAAPPPALAAAPAEESAEIDLTAMLDESVVHQLSEAIERVTRDGIRLPAWPAEARGNGSAWPPPKRAAADMWRPQSGATPVSPRAKRLPERKPIHDEWGLFDPAQCGFAALLAQLDEITHVASSLPASEPSAGSPNVSH